MGGGGGVGVGGRGMDKEVVRMEVVRRRMMVRGKRRVV